MHNEQSKAGRPRSEQARTAVLHAVDDLLSEVGYSAMTMKGIAERAGVGRQTVYRWWSTKAEILFEAVRYDAPQELAVTPSGSAEADLAAFLNKLTQFLTHSDAGLAYRALLGEAQHDPAVAALIASHDVVVAAARMALTAALPTVRTAVLADAVALLVGPTFFRALTGQDRGRSRRRDRDVVTGVLRLLG